MASRCPPLASSGKISSPTAMSHGKLEYLFKTCVLRARKWPREARTGRRRTAGVGRTPGWTLDVHNVAVDIAERGGRITINLGSPAEGRPSIAEVRGGGLGARRASSGPRCVGHVRLRRQGGDSNTPVNPRLNLPP